MICPPSFFGAIDKSRCLPGRSLKQPSLNTLPSSIHLTLADTALPQSYYFSIAVQQERALAVCTLPSLRIFYQQGHTTVPLPAVRLRVPGQALRRSTAQTVSHVSVNGVVLQRHWRQPPGPGLTILPCRISSLRLS